MSILRVQALAPADYAPFGDVIAAAPEGTMGSPANQGTALRWDHVAALHNLRIGTATPNLCVFRCTPWTQRPITLGLLERHPASTQVFVPMSALRYLVVVALGVDRPDLSTARAFIASGAQGVSYHPGVWHHPMIALDAVTDFACFVWEDGTPGDCELVRFDAHDILIVDPDATLHTGTR